MTATLLGVGVGCALGNVLYALAADQGWVIAAERTFFQAVALAAVALSLVLTHAN